MTGINYNSQPGVAKITGQLRRRYRFFRRKGDDDPVVRWNYPGFNKRSFLTLYQESIRFNFPPKYP
jgi:hypothetical protein